MQEPLWTSGHARLAVDGSWRPILRRVRPRYRPTELGRGALGALLGILVAGGVARVLPGGSEVLPYLVAPMGASAVLLFAVPASPLAQPWPLVGGNLISTAVGLGAAWVFDDVLVAAGFGVGAAIGTMMLLNCLHPPGGACALVGATAAPALQDQGLELVWMPVAINTLALLAIAIAVNNLTGRRYPHRPAEPVRRPGAPEPLGVQASDVEQAIARLDQGLDITPGDVVALLRDAETHALDRRLGSLSVSRVMERDVATVLPFESIYRARTLIAQRGVKALPVVDEERRVVGIVSILDLFTRDIVELEEIATMMTTDVVTMRADAPVAELVSLMTELGYRHVPIVDETDRLVGIVTRTELIEVLNRALLGDDLRH
jgi:CBS domain-containing membrane protein